MQNTNTIFHINNNKVVNIKSEILCREAEDDIFYFNKINSAYKKLQEAVKLSPYHLKSLLLLADICIIKGYIKKALNLYHTAEKLSASAKTFASIAYCYYRLNQYNKALEYCNTAVEEIRTDNFSLYPQITELKINVLIAQKRYKQAYITFIQAQNILDANSLKSIYNINYDLLNEKINLQKKLKSSNLKIV